MKLYACAWLGTLTAILAYALGLGDLAIAGGLTAFLALGLDIAQIVQRGQWMIRPMTLEELEALDTWADPARSLDLNNIWRESTIDDFEISGIRIS